MAIRRSRFSKRVRKSIAKKPVRRVGEKAKVKQAPLGKMKRESLKNQPVQNFPTERRVAAHGSRFRGAVEEEGGAGYLGYTTLDPGSDMIITEDKISFAGLPIDEELYVMKDYGAEYFDNFTHRFTMNLESYTDSDPATGYGGSALMYGLSVSSIHTQSAFEANGTDGFAMRFFGTPTIWGLGLTNYQGQQGIASWFSNGTPAFPNLPTTLYVEVEKYNGIYTVRFYSDSGYSSLIKDFVVPSDFTALRYHTPLGGWFGATDDDVITGYIEGFVEGTPSIIAPTYVDVDLTTYTEVDENGDLTVTANKVDVSTMRADANTYLVYDYGVDTIGEFAHRFKVNWSGVNATGYGPKGVVWAITQDTNFTLGLMSSNDDGVSLIVSSSGDGATLNMVLRDDDTDDFSVFSVASIPDDFWVEMTRRGNWVVARIYSDDAFSILAGVMAVEVNTGDYRFHLAMAGVDIGSFDDDITFYVSDYEIDNVVT